MAPSPEFEKVTRSNVRSALKVAFRYARMYRWNISGLAALSVVSALGHGVAPFIVGRFFDSLTATSVISPLGWAMPLFAALLGAWIVVQTLNHILDWKITVGTERIGNLIWTDYIATGFGKLLELPMAFHKKQKIGEVGDKISRAGGSTYELVSKATITLAPQFLSILVALAIAFSMRPSLALILVAGTALYVAVAAFTVRPLAKLDNEYYQMINKSYGDAYDAIGNALPIKQASAESYEQEKIYGGLSAALPIYMKMKSMWEMLTLSQRIVSLVTQATVLAVATYAVHQGMMTVGDLIAFFAYASMAFEPFAVLALNWQSFQTAIVTIGSVESLLDQPTEAYTPAGSRSFDVRGDVSFRSVGFQYEEGRAVLSDISFDVKAGQVVALVGESGVGKSTLVDLIGGYHFPSAGSVEIDGIDTTKLDLRSLRRQIAVVPQEVVLFNDTIRKNIGYGSFGASDKAIQEAARKAHALEFIERFPAKWEQEVGERGVKLSVGQKQRVAIARAILRDPKILVLDEPTSALDAGSEKIITESLEELMRGKTTFIIAHRLSTVRKADMILVFKDGKVVESGTHQELLKSKDGEYKRLYELQIGLHD